MNRRSFLCGLTLGTLPAPLAPEAQQAGKVYRVAVLHHTAPTPHFQALRSAMHDLGWTEGRTMVFEYRSAEGQLERLDELAREAVQSKPDVIVTGTNSATAAAKRATSTIPIVMAVSVDPVGAGLVASLAQPGGNITGQAILSPELSAKRLELLKEALPGASRVALFWTAAPRGAVLRHLEASRGTVHALGIQLLELQVRRAEDVDAAFRDAMSKRADAVITIQNPLFYALNRRIAELALRYRLPVLSSESGFAEQGGLMNYGDDTVDAWRRSAAQVNKILKGTEPADLPVEQPTKFELVINMRTAKALGLTIPPSLLLRADHVIE